jgi:hypothetical protein
MQIHMLDAIQRRHLVDLRQAYEAWREADQDVRTHYQGSMRWKESDGNVYLYRKRGTSERGLGRKSPETEAIYAAFMSGRKAARERQHALSSAVARQAAIARAAGLGRVPALAASLMRRLDEAGLLGRLRIIGTNALFAYEALAGVHVAADVLSTVDVDLLLDVRRKLRILAEDGEERTILGLLKRVDGSFRPSASQSFRVVNKDGFMVDLVCPLPRPPWKKPQKSLPDGELIPAEIEGAQWLLNCPSIEALAVDERGQPVRMLAPDPRIWMLHKFWMAARRDRDPLKAPRDRDQALCLFALLKEHLPQYPLDAEFAASIPGALSEAQGMLERRAGQ